MRTVQRTLLAFLILLAAPAMAAGVAFITNLKGDVSVDGNSRPLLLSELAAGQKIAVAAGGQAAVMYIASGREFTLGGPGEYVVREQEIDSGRGQAPVARATEWRASTRVLAQVGNTAAASVRMRSITPPRQEPAARPDFPAGGSVATLQPTFRWRAAEPGEFVLLVQGQEKPVHQAKAAGGSYRLPAKLKPDTDYAWTVTSAGAEIGSGRFRTLSREGLQTLEKRRPAEKATFSDRLLYTLMLQEMGAIQEARESWARLAQERADLPELAALAR